MLYLRNIILKQDTHFDIRLVKYCLNLPSSYKLNNGITRLILRESMKNILPEGVRNRFSKSNIGPIIDKKIVVYDLNELKAYFAKIHQFMAYMMKR